MSSSPNHQYENHQLSPRAVHMFEAGLSLEQLQIFANKFLNTSRHTIPSKISVKDVNEKVIVPLLFTEDKAGKSSYFNSIADADEVHMESTAANQRLYLSRTKSRSPLKPMVYIVHYSPSMPFSRLLEALHRFTIKHVQPSLVRFWIDCFFLPPALEEKEWLRQVEEGLLATSLTDTDRLLLVSPYDYLDVVQSPLCQYHLHIAMMQCEDDCRFGSLVELAMTADEEQRVVDTMSKPGCIDKVYRRILHAIEDSLEDIDRVFDQPYCGAHLRTVNGTCSLSAAESIPKELQLLCFLESPAMTHRFIATLDHALKKTLLYFLETRVGVRNHTSTAGSTVAPGAHKDASSSEEELPSIKHDFDHFSLVSTMSVCHAHPHVHQTQPLIGPHGSLSLGLFDYKSSSASSSARRSSNTADDMDDNTTVESCSSSIPISIPSISLAPPAPTSTPMTSRKVVRTTSGSSAATSVEGESVGAYSLTLDHYEAFLLFSIEDEEDRKKRDNLSLLDTTLLFLLEKAAVYFCYVLHEFTEAERYYMRMLDALQSECGFLHPQTLELTLRLAHIFAMTLHRPQVAEIFFCNYLTNLTQSGFSTLREQMMAYQQVANFYYVQGKFSKAEELYERWMGLSLEIHGEAHHVTLHAMSMLANVTQQQGQLDKSLSIVTRCISVAKQLHPMVNESDREHSIVSQFRQQRRQLEDEMMHVREHYLGCRNTDTDSVSKSQSNSISVTLADCRDNELCGPSSSRARATSASSRGSKRSTGDSVACTIC